jgi:hypothetical protein
MSIREHSGYDKAVTKRTLLIRKHSGYDQTVTKSKSTLLIRGHCAFETKWSVDTMIL